MKTIPVKDIMVPLEEYATVSEDATLHETVMALEKAQEELDRDRYHYLHRAVLVLNKENQVVGKVSQLDALRALEPKYGTMGELGRISLGGFSPQFLKSILQQYSLLEKPLDEICTKAASRKVKDFMHKPAEGEYIQDNASLNEAIHMLIMGQHQSLLVTSGERIVGLLRLTDVFKFIFQVMKTCEI